MTLRFFAKKGSGTGNLLYLEVPCPVSMENRNLFNRIDSLRPHLDKLSAWGGTISEGKNFLCWEMPPLEEGHTSTTEAFRVLLKSGMYQQSFFNIQYR